MTVHRLLPNIHSHLHFVYWAEKEMVAAAKIASTIKIIDNTLFMLSDPHRYTCTGARYQWSCTSQAACY